MPSATLRDDSNGYAERHTNGTDELSSQGLDLTVLGLNSGTSMVIMLYDHKAKRNLTIIGWYRLRSLQISTGNAKLANAFRAS